MMKELLITFNLLATLSLQAATKSNNIKVVIYADNAYSPYSFENEDKQVTGIYTEILRSVFTEIKGYEVKIIAMPWKRAMSELKQNIVFAVYPPYFRPKERPFIKEYSTPILEENIVVYSTKEILKSPRPNWPNDWHDLTIGLFLGTIDIAGPKFAKALSEGKIKKKEFLNNEKNVLSLAHERIDAYVNDRNAILYTIKKLSKNERFAKLKHKLVEGPLVSKEWGYLAFARDKKKYPYKADFIKKFNTIIKRYKKEGKIQKILKRFLTQQ